MFLVVVDMSGSIPVTWVELSAVRSVKKIVFANDRERSVI